MTQTAKIMTEEEKQIASQRSGWVLLSAARGPDALVVALWTAVLISVGGADGVCGHFGHSSGSDGQLCTADSAWNETLWQNVGGLSCTVEQTLGVKYSHDPNLPGCASALNDYRAELPYTCNCTGDYAFLEEIGGARIATVIQLCSALCFVALAFYLPVLGTYLDFCPDRKSPLRAHLAVMVVSLVGMVCVYPDYVWLISVVFFCGLFVSTDAASVIQSTFVSDLSNTEAEMVQLTATGQGCFFSAMVVTAFVSLALKIAIGAPLNTRVTMVLAALWGTVGFYAISKLPSRPPRREKSGSLASVPFREMALLMRELCSEYPQCGRYIVALCLSNNGLVTFTIVYPTYFTIQQKLTAADITMISGLTVLVGAIMCFLFSKVVHRFRVKSVLAFTIFGWGLVTAFIPLFVYKEGDRRAALSLAVVYGFGMALYWSTQYSALVSLLPEEKIGKYTGLFSSCKNITCAFGPTLYAAIAQASNNHRLAIFTSLVPFFALALVPLYFTDFEQGAKDARRPSRADLPNILDVVAGLPQKPNTPEVYEDKAGRV